MDPSPSLVQLRLLGGFDVQSGQGAAAIPAGRKVRALMACLAASPGMPWPREKLMALLWSDRGEEQARASLRQALAELRRALGEPAALRTEHDAVSLDPGQVAVDVLEFERLARAGKWQEAAALYRGPLLEGHGVRDDAFEDWVRVERARLHDLAVTVLDRLAASQTGEEAIATAQRLLQLDPAREETHRLLMTLYSAGGQRTQALRQYEQCREALRRELQTAPDAETDRLHHQIQNDAAPAMPQGPGVPALGKPSIVILPFTNLSGDPAQEYFSDGITGDIIAELSRFHEISVIASSSAFRFKGSHADIQEIAARLGVNYVVEGSVRQSGNRVRVTAQLIDAENANHLWAERYDREMADVFDLQDEVARTIVISVAGRVSAAGAERALRKPTASLSAYDNYLRARERFRGYDPLLEGEPFLLKAIDQDPRFALAHAMLGLVSVMKYVFSGDTSHLQEAEARGKRAVALESGEAWCQTTVGHALLFQGRLDEAGPYFERAVAFNPNDTWLGTIRAMYLSYAGRSDEALSTMAEIFRRDPIPLDWYWDVLAIIQTAAGRYADAIASYKRMVSVPSWAFAYLAICHIGLDQVDEARAAAAKFSGIGVRGTIAAFLDMEPYRDPAVIARFRAALAAGGVPEGKKA